MHRNTMHVLAERLDISQSAQGQPISARKDTHVMARVLECLCYLHATHLISSMIVWWVEVGNHQNFHTRHIFTNTKNVIFRGTLPLEALHSAGVIWLNLKGCRASCELSSPYSDQYRNTHGPYFSHSFPSCVFPLHAQGSSQ